MLGKVSLYKGKRLFAADGKAGVLALEADVQIPCPLGIVAAAAQADSNDGVLLAVYADLFVCDTNAKVLRPGRFVKSAFASKSSKPI